MSSNNTNRIALSNQFIPSNELVEVGNWLGKNCYFMMQGEANDTTMEWFHRNGRKFARLYTQEYNNALRISMAADLKTQREESKNKDAAIAALIAVLTPEQKIALGMEAAPEKETPKTKSNSKKSTPKKTSTEIESIETPNGTVPF